MTRFLTSAALALFVFAGAACREHRPEQPSPGHPAGSQDERAATSLMGVVAKGTVVTFTTSDGVVIEGTFTPADRTPAPVVLCLHMWRSDRTAWAGMTDLLHAAGMAVLAIDMRGYGGSTKKRDGTPVPPDRIARADVAAAVEFLKGRKEVDATRIGILGASYGSSNALIYAAGDPMIRALVLLSPGLNYFNVLPTEEAMRQYARRPALCIASSEDMRSVEALDAYAKLNIGATIRKLENAGHGTDMLTASHDLGAAIRDYFEKHL